MADNAALSLDRVKAFFTQGTLAAKCSEAEALMTAGDTTLFAGRLRWSVTLLDADKRLKGESLSMDAAFADMHAACKMLMKNHDAAEPILCAVEEMSA